METDESAHWHWGWFNEDYLKLYQHRDQKEADQQVDFLIQKLHLQGDERILDLGCGSGRHVLPFGERGFEIVGVDASDVLLQEARKQLTSINSPSNIKFVSGDISQLKYLGAFDLVLSLFTSFGYYEDDASNSRVIATAAMHLKVGGRFVLDFLHPAKVYATLSSQEVKQVDGEEVTIFKSIEGDTVTKMIHFPGRTYVEKVKLYTREQITQMLNANHFQVISVWNDYSGNPWCEDGDRQLFFTEKY